MEVTFVKIAGAQRYTSSNGWNIGKAQGFHVYWYADPKDEPPTRSEDHRVRVKTFDEIKEWVRKQV